MAGLYDSFSDYQINKTYPTCRPFEKKNTSQLRRIFSTGWCPPDARSRKRTKESLAPDGERFEREKIPIFPSCRVIDSTCPFGFMFASHCHATNTRFFASPPHPTHCTPIHFIDASYTHTHTCIDKPNLRNEQRSLPGSACETIKRQGTQSANRHFECLEHVVSCCRCFRQPP